jgi:hypothetical protein
VRLLFAFLLLAGLAVLAALLFRLNSGYVLFVAPPYRVEISLNAFILFAVAAFVVVHLLLRLAARIARMPAEVRAARRRSNVERARGKQDASVVALGDTGGGIRLWRPREAGRSTAVLKPGQGRMTSMALSPDGRRLAVAFPTGRESWESRYARGPKPPPPRGRATLRLFEIRVPGGATDVEGPQDSNFLALAFHPTKPLLAAAGVGDVALVDDFGFDVAAERVVGAVLDQEAHQRQAIALEHFLLAHVQRGAARAGVDLGADRADAQARQRQPLAPSEQDGRRRRLRPRLAGSRSHVVFRWELLRWSG